MLRRAFLIACALVFSSPAFAQSNSSLPSPSRTPQPRSLPANDPFPPRTQLRVPTVASNDNMLRGLGRSAGALNDELRLVMSAQEANSRTARYVRGVSATISGTGGAAATRPWLSRLGAIGKLGKPIGYIITVASLGYLAFDLYSYGDSDTQVGNVLDDAYIDQLDPSFEGRQVWASVFIPGAYYKQVTNFTQAVQPGVDYPVSRLFIVPTPCVNQCLAQGWMWMFFEPMPSTYTGPPTTSPLITGTENGRGWQERSTTFQAPDGKWYRQRYRSFSTGFGGIEAGRARWVEDPLNPGWWRFVPPTDPNRLDPATMPATTAPLKPTTPAAPIPPEWADAPVTPGAVRPFIDEGLRSAGLDAPDAVRESLAQTAAFGVKAGDLNTIPDPEALANPAASPLGSYVPQPTADAIAEPSTPSNPGAEPNPGTNPGAEPFPGLELQVEEPGDMPGIPNVTVPYVEIGPVACPRYNLGTTTEDPRANEILRIAGVRSDDPTDMMCQPLEENAIWLRPLIFALWTMLALGIFKGNA